MALENLVKIQMKEIRGDTIIWYPEIKDLCSRPYPNHPKGCPNIEKCQELNIPEFGIINECGEYNHYYLVYAKFDFEQYKQERLNGEKGDWFSVGKRAECLIYYQNSVKKLLTDYINSLGLDKKSYVFGCGSGTKLKHQNRVGSMENSCINVFSTMKLNGIKMEVKPKNVIYLVCLICCKEKLDNGEKDFKEWL